MGLIFGRKSIAGSLIGGIAETQEMLDFCAEHGIVSEIEMIGPQDIEAGYERMLKSEVKYRCVIDAATRSRGARCASGCALAAACWPGRSAAPAAHANAIPTISSTMRCILGAVALTSRPR
jgi:hypothetical protein